MILGHYYVSHGDMANQIGRHLGGIGDIQEVEDRCEDIGGNAYVYAYPNGDWDVVCAAERTWHAPGWEVCDKQRARVAPAPRGAGKSSEGADALRSMRRARAKLRQLALSNQFRYFVTLTLSPDEVDRYDSNAVMRKVNRWLDNMVRRYGLRYILVPEQHKDGAWHFHGFMAGEGLTAVDSGVRWDGRVVYNLPQWRLGFTTAQELYGDYVAAVAYCCKYIGKQQGQRPMGRWYYSGGALAKPERQLVTLEYRQLLADYPEEAVELEIPGTRMVVIHHRGNKTD